jgi:hypothetical protein
MIAWLVAYRDAAPTACGLASPTRAIRRVVDEVGA